MGDSLPDRDLDNDQTEVRDWVESTVHINHREIAHYLGWRDVEADLPSGRKYDGEAYWRAFLYREILDDFDVGGTEDRLEEYTLETLEEYTTTYRDDWEAARKDWGPVFEAITAW